MTADHAQAFDAAVGEAGSEGGVVVVVGHGGKRSLLLQAPAAELQLF